MTMKNYYVIETRRLDFPVLVNINKYSKEVLKKHFKNEEEAIKFITEWYLEDILKRIMTKGNVKYRVGNGYIISLQNFYVSERIINIYKKK